ncbi:MAG: hypothetical protein AAF480_10285, partial [Actinomycetota bacterium]
GWSVRTDGDAATGFDIGATAIAGEEAPSDSEVAEIVIGTALGLSPGRREGRLEGVQMLLEDRRVRTVALVDLDSEYLGGFRSAVPAETLLMTDVDVVWRRDRDAVSRLDGR